ncbi:PREDICTED: uncharacterized protein LOC106544348 [Thamnophis sirtalis]|uniref:Uncharacterized protein LOC106544348 n=1 Tax=Thamnophis sirtalis TaxID=35019 RepID=A0A6I9XZM6_9SAUR|nr:PREDICTED: uncharacterized protein LOC106544348 [Thamnophis sirtalis]
MTPSGEHFADGSPNPLALLSERVCVKKDWLEDVVRKDRYRVNNKHDKTHPPLPLSKILWQTEELVGKEMPYSLSSQNCENFVMELRYGPEMSEQSSSFIAHAVDQFSEFPTVLRFIYREGHLVEENLGWVELSASPASTHILFFKASSAVHGPGDRLANGAASVLAVLSDRAYVKKDWLETVVRNDQYRVNNKHDHTYPPLPLTKTLERAEELVGREMPYNLTSHNCEHFVMELRYGIAMSDQTLFMVLFTSHLDYCNVFHMGLLLKMKKWLNQSINQSINPINHNTTLHSKQVPYAVLLHQKIFQSKFW